MIAVTGTCRPASIPRTDPGVAKRKQREPLELTIEALADDGYGLADGGRVGVTGALPGERVVAMPFTKKKRRLFARAESIDAPHQARVDPPCAAAAWCGGCSLQHADPDWQIAHKFDRLKSAFGNIEPDIWLPPLRGPVSKYCSKARLAVKYVRAKERVLVGFREKMQPFVADISRCEILVSPLDSMIEPLAALVSRLSVAAALPQIEVACGEERSALVFRHLEPLTEADVAMLCEFGAGHGIDIYAQPGGLDTVHKLFPDNEPRLHYTLPSHDIDMAFHPMDFTQVNQEINRNLVDLALDLLDVDASTTVLDLFCGIGNFTLPLARRAQSVHGVELSETSVERARENANRNRIRNATFEAKDLFRENALPDVLPDRVLLDPPRSGAAAVCQGLASRKVQRVVYVSCNPATLAEDIRVLTESGYRLERAGVIDMFPHTTHVESIACLSTD